MFTNTNLDSKCAFSINDFTLDKKTTGPLFGNVNQNKPNQPLSLFGSSGPLFGAQPPVTSNFGSGAQTSAVEGKAETEALTNSTSAGGQQIQGSSLGIGQPIITQSTLS